MHHAVYVYRRNHHADWTYMLRATNMRAHFDLQRTSFEPVCPPE